MVAGWDWLIGSIVVVVVEAVTNPKNGVQNQKSDTQ